MDAFLGSMAYSPPLPPQLGLRPKMESPHPSPNVDAIAVPVAPSEVMRLNTRSRADCDSTTPVMPARALAPGMHTNDACSPEAYWLRM
eukprot:268331-Chlamydomonas_euryale.AAC.1